LASVYKDMEIGTVSSPEYCIRKRVTSRPYLVRLVSATRQAQTNSCGVRDAHLSSPCQFLSSEINRRGDLLVAEEANWRYEEGTPFSFPVELLTFAVLN
jgi:hypothetical protein